jgi:hypothetical protein
MKNGTKRVLCWGVIGAACCDIVEGKGPIDSLGVATGDAKDLAVYTAKGVYNGAAAAGRKVANASNFVIDKVLSREPKRHQKPQLKSVS